MLIDQKKLKAKMLMGKSYFLFQVFEMEWKDV